MPTWQAVSVCKHRFDKLYYREYQGSRTLIDKTFTFTSFPPMGSSLVSVGLAARSVCQQLPYRSATDHLDCFYSKLLSFPDVSEVEKNTQGSVCIKENGFRIWRGDKKGKEVNRIKHSNVWDSEEDNGESNMPTNDMTPRSKFLFPESIRHCRSISESEGQVLSIP